MVSIVVIIFVLVIAASIVGYEQFQKQKFIAKYVDGQPVTGNYITSNTEAIVEKLKNPGDLKVRRSSSSIILPDGQELYYGTKDVNDFAKHSKLNYEPNSVEWAILLGLVQKLVNR